MRADDFHRLQSRLRLTGVLRTCTALRIGAGGGDLDGIDLPVIKDSAGFPLLPGASLKGAVRSTVEALLRGAAQQDAGLWACDPLEDDETSPHRSCGYHKRGERLDVRPEKHCAACRLFGSHVVASHVRFCDAQIPRSAADRESRRIPVEVRDGVSIDRDLRRAARDGRKFDFEVVSPGVVFALEIFVDNPQPWLMGLLVMGFDQLAEGFTAVGGFTSRGLGRVSFTWSSIASCTAASLLRGEPPVIATGDEVTVQMRAWRAALADHAKENA